MNLVSKLNRRALTGALLLISALAATTHAQTFNYAEVLQKSMFFYEAQRSGFLPDNNRVNWRGDSALADGMDVGRDLAGGWYDAGDHVKFGFPMAFSVTALAWGAIDFADGYNASGQMQHLRNNLRHVTDYLIACHTAPNELYGQVGNGGIDHAWWGSAEVMMMSRPSYKIDTARPGSDLAGETAAALAAASMVFASVDPAYSATLRSHAIQLYNFADNFRGVYTSGIPDAQGYYNSWSGFNDELVWGAIWLYRATGDPAYLAKAEAYYANLSNEPQSTIKSYRWTLAWDDKAYGSYVLLAKLTGKAQYKEDAERNLDYWTTGFNGQRVNYSPGGLAWLDQWGSLRYAANASFLAMYYHDVATTPAKGTQYYNFAKRQIDYALGNNPSNRSYVCGFGVNPPVNPHHRTAHGAWANNLVGPPTETRHILYGALVGGPNLSDTYVDNRGDFQRNEVATDYNALFSGVLAKLVDDFGGTPLANFPVPETPTGEYVVEVRQNAAGTTFMEVAVWVHNHTAWPARIPSQVRFRIFVNITEGIAAGFSASQYVIGTNNGNVVTVTPLQLWNAAQNVYFTEVTFRPNVVIWPGGQSESSEEAQVRVALPNNSPAAAWSTANDFSFQSVTGSLQPTTTMPLFVDGTLVVGSTPPGGGPNVPVTGVNVTPATATVAVGATTSLTATVSPANASNPTVTWSTSAPAIATVSAAGVVTGVAGGSATITATTQDGGFTDTTAVTVTAANTLTVTPATLSFTSAASSLPVTVTSNVAWTVTDNQPWITVAPASGANNGTVTVSAAANTGSARSGTVTITGGGLTRTVAVNQAAGGNTLTVAPTSLSFTSAAGSNTVAVTSNVAWTVTDNQTWITVTPTTGANNATLTVSVTANTGTVARSGTVTVTGGGLTATVAVTQEGTTPTTLTVSTAALMFTSAAGSNTFGITSNVTWTTADDQTWITVTPPSGANNATATVSVTANTATTNRTGTITVTGGGLTRTISVTQAGAGGSTPCTNPVPITLTFTRDGAGDFCWVTGGTINFINSWNMQLLEVNGVNFTGQWVSGANLPPRVNGNYYIRYIGQFPWSHFEAFGTP